MIVCMLVLECSIRQSHDVHTGMFPCDDSDVHAVRRHSNDIEAAGMWLLQAVRWQ